MELIASLRFGKEPATLQYPGDHKRAHHLAVQSAVPVEVVRLPTAGSVQRAVVRDLRG